MLPEKMEQFSFRKSWHVIIILLATSLAVASETSNFLLNDTSIVWITSSKQDEKQIAREEKNLKWISSAEFQEQCIASSENQCLKMNPYLRWVLLLVLFICAWRYWSLDNKNREILDIFREIFDNRGKNPDEEIDNTLKLIAVRRLKFHGEDRVSVYKYHRELSSFFRIGRFSTDPTFSGGGAKQYSKDKGVIAAAWKGDSCVAENVPAFQDGKIKDYKKYLDDRSIGNFSIKDIRTMRMRSRSFYAYTIHDSESIKTAVIVFESTTPNRFSERTLRSFLTSEQGKILKQLICKRIITTDMEPSI